jgi:hypothetical protein
MWRRRRAEAFAQPFHVRQQPPPRRRTGFARSCIFVALACYALPFAVIAAGVLCLGAWHALLD